LKLSQVFILLDAKKRHAYLKRIPSWQLLFWYIGRMYCIVKASENLVEVLKYGTVCQQLCFSTFVTCVQ